MRITIAKGDGIGPEIMDATLKILKAAGADLEYDEIEIVENVRIETVKQVKGHTQQQVDSKDEETVKRSILQALGLGAG